MRIDFVQDDDWAGIYVDGKLLVQDHSIRDDHWIELIEIAFLASKYAFSDNILDIFKWWVNLNENGLSHMPEAFTEVEKLKGLEAG